MVHVDRENFFWRIQIIEPASRIGCGDALGNAFAQLVERIGNALCVPGESCALVITCCECKNVSFVLKLTADAARISDAFLQLRVIPCGIELVAGT